ncbi:hypothetical protein RJ639_030458 [Escallonia herrerae]|uniref:DUF7722 domain-containing protein n=1 Tax=Escallonia herrerae TaxID=1293975 RepID=A0AA88X8A0_9ASTE|nr:hypothetical protein RJ639_030458 [Escallonia herrerae]
MSMQSIGRPHSNAGGGGGGNGQRAKDGWGGYFQMPLHYPRYTRAEYETMPEWKLDCLLTQYGLPVTGDVNQKRKFARRLELGISKDGILEDVAVQVPYPPSPFFHAIYTHFSILAEKCKAWLIEWGEKRGRNGCGFPEFRGVFMLFWSGGDRKDVVFALHTTSFALGFGARAINGIRTSEYQNLYNQENDPDHILTGEGNATGTVDPNMVDDFALPLATSKDRSQSTVWKIVKYNVRPTQLQIWVAIPGSRDLILLLRG